MDFDYITDNEDQMYKELVESEQKKKDEKKVPRKRTNNYDDETEER